MKYCFSSEIGAGAAVGFARCSHYWQGLMAAACLCELPHFISTAGNKQRTPCRILSMGWLQHCTPLCLQEHSSSFPIHTRAAVVMFRKRLFCAGVEHLECAAWQGPNHTGMVSCNSTFCAGAVVLLAPGSSFCSLLAQSRLGSLRVSRVFIQCPF